MPEIIKMNITKILATISILVIVAGAWGSVDSRIDRLERFESVMEERTRNMSNRVDDIYDIIKDWAPTGDHNGQTKEKD